MKTLTATFADGAKKHRNVRDLPYTHGWRVRYAYTNRHGERCTSALYGFAANAGAATTQAINARKGGGPSNVIIIDREIVLVTTKETT